MLKTLAEYALHADVELLYADYCEALDNADLARWPEFFVNDCLYRITTRENLESGSQLCFVHCDGHAMVRDRALALTRTVYFRKRYQRRVFSGVKVRASEGFGTDAIAASASFTLYESVDEDPSRLVACGCSRDIVVREGNGLKFKDRLCVLDARVMPDSLIYPL